MRGSAWSHAPRLFSPHCFYPGWLAAPSSPLSAQSSAKGLKIPPPDKDHCQPPEQPLLSGERTSTSKSLEEGLCLREAVTEIKIKKKREKNIIQPWWSFNNPPRRLPRRAGLWSEGFLACRFQVSADRRFERSPPGVLDTCRPELKWRKLCAQNSGFPGRCSSCTTEELLTCPTASNTWKTLESPTCDPQNTDLLQTLKHIES